MPKRKDSKFEKPSIESIRYTEYYCMQEKFDDLYARSKNGEVFTDLIELILSRRNILLAYKNIKSNNGSYTPGTDKLTIKDISKLTADEVVFEVRTRFIGKRKIGYKPQAITWKNIPKSNGSARPLGIPSIWDRLIQQCIKQILEPICEAKFSNHSYGFRPMRSTENAMAELYKLIQLSNLHQVVEFDIKSFFEEVNHVKLIHQLWALGIRDTSLIFRLKSILKCPIKMHDGKIYYPNKGIYQAGILCPLFTNVVLNELDHWIESKWEEHPMVYKYTIGVNKQGSPVKSNAYVAMRRVGVKEMHIVRYADDFRILCRTRNQALFIKGAVSRWLKKRLRLDVSPEKTKIVNIKKHFSDFLGFKVKVKPKSKKYVVTSHISNKQLKAIRKKLSDQVKKIPRPRDGNDERFHIKLYNSMVLEIQGYYQIATDVNLDLLKINRIIMTLLTNRLKRGKNGRLSREGRKLSSFEEAKFGSSKMLRYVKGSKEPIYPIGYIQCKNPMLSKRGITPYSPEGRAKQHQNLSFKNIQLLRHLLKKKTYDQSIEYADNRISKFSAQHGECAVTGMMFESLDEIHCHHIIPKKYGGNDSYDNLVLILEPVHKLIHAVKDETIHKYCKMLSLNGEQIETINKFRKSVKLEPIAICLN